MVVIRKAVKGRRGRWRWRIVLKLLCSTSSTPFASASWHYHHPCCWLEYLHEHHLHRAAAMQCNGWAVVDGHSFPLRWAFDWWINLKAATHILLSQSPVYNRHKIILRKWNDYPTERHCLGMDTLPDVNWFCIRVSEDVIVCRWTRAAAAVVTTTAKAAVEAGWGVVSSLCGISM